MIDDIRPRPGTTTIAAVLMVLVCIPFLINGWELVQIASDPSAADEELQHALIMTGFGGGGSREIRTLGIIGAGLMLGLCLLSLVLALGVFRRREGAQHATIVVFAVLGLIALTSAAQGLFSDPPAEGAKQALAVGLTNIGIVALLLTNSTREDVEWMESVRARRRYERQDARAARKAARQQ